MANSFASFTLISPLWNGVKVEHVFLLKKVEYVMCISEERFEGCWILKQKGHAKLPLALFRFQLKFIFITVAIHCRFYLKVWNEFRKSRKLCNRFECWRPIIYNFNKNSHQGNMIVWNKFQKIINPIWDGGCSTPPPTLNQPPKDPKIRDFSYFYMTYLKSKKSVLFLKVILGV